MALGSWNALYTVVEQKFMRKRQWRQLHLLKVFVQHADPFGLSFPGPDLISELTGIGTIKQINETLEWLRDGEYIKIWERWNRWKRIWETEYQVSPLVMYIREELQVYAEKVWNAGERDFDYEDVVVIKRNGQPTSEPESEPTSVTNISNHHHHPAKYAERQLTTVLSGDDYETQAERPKQRKRKTGKAKAEEKNPQAGGGAPIPDKLDLRKYQSPLPRPDDEDRAQDVQVMLRMRISQARGLVANYGAAAVAVAAAATKDAMDRGACLNPPGLMTFLLKRGGSSPADASLYNGAKNDIAAETARLESYQD